MFHIFNSLEHEPCNCDSYIEREPIETMKLNILDAKVVSREVESGVWLATEMCRKYSDKTLSLKNYRYQICILYVCSFNGHQ